MNDPESDPRIEELEAALAAGATGPRPQFVAAVRDELVERQTTELIRPRPGRLWASVIVLTAVGTLLLLYVLLRI